MFVVNITIRFLENYPGFPFRIHEIKHDQLSNVNIAVTNIVTLAVFNECNSKDVSLEFDVN